MGKLLDVFAGIVALLFLAIIVCYFFGVNDMRRTTFTGVIAYNTDVNFEEVWVRKNNFSTQRYDVHFSPGVNEKGYEIRIDKQISGTLLDVSFRFVDNIVGGLFFLRAKKVVVWVPNEKEKKIWVDFFDKIYQKKILNAETKKRMPKPKQVLPISYY